MTKISIIKQEGIIEVFSYERRVYESVDDIVNLVINALYAKCEINENTIHLFLLTTPKSGLCPLM